MAEAFICDAIRTPIGRFGGTLAAVRADDLAAIPIKALVERNALVLLRYERGALVITAEGRALDRGALGDRIRVTNLSSRQTVVGRIAADGAGEVHP